MTDGTLMVNGGKITASGTGTTGVEVTRGIANVMGATITLQGDGGKGFKVSGSGKVMMMGGSITGNRRDGTTGVEMEGSADVTLNGVNISEVQKGVEMRGGTLTVNGKSKIKVVGGGTGLNIAGSGTVTMSGTEITAGGSGKGVVMKGNANVTLNGVNISEVQKGVEMGGSGVLTLNGDSKITVQGNGTGMSVSKGNVVMTGTLRIEVKQGGTGMSVSNGTVMMNGTTTITVAAGGKGLDVSGGTVTMKGTTTITASGTGTTGVSVSGGEVMMNDVNISNFATGITMTGGEKLTVEGGSIRGKGHSGVGINVTGGTVTVESVNISEFATGINMEGSGNLTVKDGSITGSGRGGVGIDAKSGSGNVTVDGVNVSGFTTGVEMGGTGTLTVSGTTTISFTGDGTGVKVGESVTMTSLTDVTISGRGSGSKGVWVMGGEVTMNTVGISNVGTGVYMETGVKSASLKDVKIERAERGISMKGSGTLTVSGTTMISFTGDGYGVYAGESVTNTRLTDVKIMGNGGSKSKGVWVKGGAVVMERVTITGVKMGIMMKGKGTFTVEGVGISFTGGVSYEYGIGVGDKVTRARLTDVTITGSGKGSGVFMMGGEVTMERVNVSQVATGIWVTGGTLIMKEGTKIGFTKDYGIKLGGTVAKAELTGVTIEGSGKGEGIYAMGGVLMVSGGEIKEVEKGIMMMGGTLTVKDNTRIEFTKDYGIKVGKGVTGEVKIEKGTKITGSNKGKGVVWEGAGTLTLDGVEMLKVATGVYATGSGNLTVSGGEINFMGEYGYGVMVGKEVTSATLTNVKITGRGKTGVLMGSSGTLTKVEISGVQTGVEVTGSGKLTMEEGKIEFTGTHGVMVEGGAAELKGTKIVGSGNSGMGMIRGIYVGNGSLTLTGVGISEVQMGIKMMGNGTLTVKDGTRIEFMAGGTGVSVGNSVTANLTGVEIKGKGSGYGVGMRGKTMTMTRVNVSKVETGVEVSKGDLTVVGGTITGVKEGIMMMGDGVMVVSGGTRIEFTKDYGIKLGRKVGALVTNVEIKGSKKGDGIYAEGGVLMVSGGSIKEVERGITMMGYGRLTVKDNTKIGFTGDGYGMYVGTSVTANLKGTVIRGSGNSGVGVYTVGGKMVMKQVDISNVGTGVEMSGGTLIMKGGRLGLWGGMGWLLREGQLL
ncbi:right-handed parallel beta-helix repeat-containing protein [Bartonella schoenbuchensis]|uniref:right-handed parallel beta-helix repeat-containing protein n=1 Tax=Bartonella schoenbuchensis TaxID=165694 RepID=UPI0031451956